MELVALLPWWAGVALAVASWALFHSIAKAPAPSIDLAHATTGSFLGVWFRVLAPALQYVVPFMCAAGAMVSFARRKRRSGLVAKATASPSANALHDMSWREFEVLVGEAFRPQGYEVVEKGGAQPDGGVDLVLRKGQELFLVQCKQWKAFKVGVDVARELYGVMAARGAAGGFVVTSGTFTQDAAAFAEGRNLRLLDGAQLHALLQQARKALWAPREVQQARKPEAAAPSSASTAAQAPSCPKCNAPMVRRTAKKGAYAGSEFWGCSRFPACYGARGVQQPAA